MTSLRLPPVSSTRTGFVSVGDQVMPGAGSPSVTPATCPCAASVLRALTCEEATTQQDQREHAMPASWPRARPLLDTHAECVARVRALFGGGDNA